MARYDRAYDRSLRPRSGDPASPYGSRRGMRYDRKFSGRRPWVGGYTDEYQGGSYGIPVGGSPVGGFGDRSGRGYDGGYRGGYDGGFRGMRHRESGREGRGSRPDTGGRDLWWLGERAFDHDRESYDDAYRRFNESTRPRFSPVGGNYHAMGGRYLGHPPEQLREERWFSDWTRWF
jgi:hypothetical protein